MALFAGLATPAQPAEAMDLSERVFELDDTLVDPNPPKRAGDGFFPNSQPLTLASDGLPCETVPSALIPHLSIEGKEISPHESTDTSRNRMLSFYSSNAHRWPRVVQKRFLELAQKRADFFVYDSHPSEIRFWKLASFPPGEEPPSDAVAGMAEVYGRPLKRHFRADMCDTGAYVFAWGMVRRRSDYMNIYYDAVRARGALPDFEITAGDFKNGQTFLMTPEVSGCTPPTHSPSASSLVVPWDGPIYFNTLGSSPCSSQSSEHSVRSELRCRTHSDFRAVISVASTGIDLDQIDKQTRGYQEGWSILAATLKAAITAHQGGKFSTRTVRTHELSRFLSRFAEVHYGVGQHEAFFEHLLKKTVRTAGRTHIKTVLVNLQREVINMCAAQRFFATTNECVERLSRSLESSGTKAPRRLFID